MAEVSSVAPDTEVPAFDLHPEATADQNKSEMKMVRKFSGVVLIVPLLSHSHLDKNRSDKKLQQDFVY